MKSRLEHLKTRVAIEGHREAIRSLQKPYKAANGAVYFGRLARRTKAKDEAAKAKSKPKAAAVPSKAATLLKLEGAALASANSQGSVMHNAGRQIRKDLAEAMATATPAEQAKLKAKFSPILKSNLYTQ